MIIDYYTKIYSNRSYNSYDCSNKSRDRYKFSTIEQQNGENKEIKINIGYTSIVPTLPIFVALENGYFVEEGLDVYATQFDISNQLAKAMLNGDVDLAGAISTSVIITLEQKFPNSFKIIADNTLSSKHPITQIVVMNDSNINNITDLEGKKLGVFPGSTSLIHTRIAFEDMLGKDLDMEYVQILPNLWLESLSTGGVDAILTYEPFTTLILIQRKGKVLYDGPYEKHIMDNLPGGVTIIPTKLTEENPEAADKLKKAIKKAIEYINSNEEDARLILTKYMPMTEEVARRMNLPEWHIAEDIDVDKLQRYADILYNEGELEGPIDVSNMIYR